MDLDRGKSGKNRRKSSTKLKKASLERPGAVRKPHGKKGARLIAIERINYMFFWDMGCNPCSREPPLQKLISLAVERVIESMLESPREVK